MIVRRLSMGAATIAASLLLFVALVPASDLKPGAATDKRIVFVCMNGVSMSVWSASTFNRLAARAGLRTRAYSRASTTNYASVPLRMRFALALEGFRVGDYRPRVINGDESGNAERVVLIETELPQEASRTQAPIEHWDGFVPMREKYFEGRRALVARVADLVRRVAEAERAAAPAAPQTKAGPDHRSDPASLYRFVAAPF